MKRFDNRGALALTKKKLLITLGVVLGVALITWGVLMVNIFGKPGDADKKKTEKQPVPEGYKEVYLLTKKSENFGKNETRVSQYKYDEYGRLIREQIDENFEAQKVKIYSTFEYDGDGNLIKTVSEYVFSDGTTHIETVENRYNSEGLLLEQNTTHEDEMVSGLQYTYNQDGTIVRMTFTYRDMLSDTFYDDEGKILRRMEKRNSEEERLAEEYVYSDDGLLMFYCFYSDSRDSHSVTKIVYEYDSSGRKVKEQTYEDERLIEAFDYPEEGKSLKYTLPDPDETDASSELYLCEESWVDEAGNEVLYRKFRPNGSVLGESKHQYEYNEYGKILSEKEFNYRGELTQWAEYEYTDLSMKAGKYAKRTTYAEDGSIWGWEELEFFMEADGDVWVVKDMYYSAYNEGDGYYYSFDENGNPEKKIFVYRDGSTEIDETRKYERFLIPITE